MLKRPPVGVLVVLGLAALTAALAWRSRGWPLIHDAPLMHYVAWRIGRGAVPYRDLFDMNFPGVYLLHMLALRLFGAGCLGVQMFSRQKGAAGRAGCQQKAIAQERPAVGLVPHCCDPVVIR